MVSANPSSVRVLIRPPPASSTPSSSAPPLPLQSSADLPPLPPTPTTPLPPPSPPVPLQTPSSSQPRPPEGVVVVGFVGRRPGDVCPLINRVLDANAFGSGNLDRSFGIDTEEFRVWSESRSISYYHEKEGGILYLQYASERCPAFGRVPTDSNFDSVLEEREFGDLQGLLFMFSVCHVIIYVQDGSHFDTQLLKKIRILQAAKHALSSFMRSRIAPPSVSRSHSSRASVPANISNRRSPGRSRGIFNRNASFLSSMNGLGSHASLFPGQCTPVALFVFLDDFSDILKPSTKTEGASDSSSLNQSSSLNGLTRPGLPGKGTGPVVVLGRPLSKSEGDLKKKLQSSLEAQIRFLIKKCRTLSGSESSHHAGSRNAVMSSSASLFSLDGSRAVVLLERCTNQEGESLEFATSLVEDVLSGKSSSDSFLNESHGQSAAKEDIQSMKEFIYRQSDILRGRGGVISNTNSGSAAGVGMVAVAAAAAAASAASRKTLPAPELPSFGTWLSSSETILQEMLSAKCRHIEEAEINKSNTRQRNAGLPEAEAITSNVTDSIEIAVSLLEKSKGLNMKFSTLWCQRALPTAKEIYLYELPACYPTAQHKAHLEKALRAFSSMVKGPAVQHFLEKLEDECVSIWASGRQQCDAISLTGKPCLHQRHDVEGDGSLSGAACMPHSSGFVFLHACACGRSRKLRSDPFDFASANNSSSHFPDCDKILPAVQLPNISVTGPILPSSWSLIRIGGARYYEPSKGLLQSGFCPTQKFLFQWTFYLEKWTGASGSSYATGQVSEISSDAIPKVECIDTVHIEKHGATQLSSGEVHGGVQIQMSPLENVKSDNRKINFGKGLPNFMMKKPFAEVVAGSAAADSGFPPLHSKKQPAFDSEKGPKQVKARDRVEERVHATSGNESLLSFKNVASLQTSNDINPNGRPGGEPFLQIGSNVVPVNVSGGKNMKSNTSLKHATVYVGFEHECPHGHRFLLTPEHLNDLGPFFSLPEERHRPPSVEKPNQRVADTINLGRNGGHGPRIKVQRDAKNTAAASREKNSGKLKEKFGNSSHHFQGVMQSYEMGMQQDQQSVGVSSYPESKNRIEERIQSLSLLDDGGYAFSLLNRNVPVYMNCPHCRTSKARKDQLKIKFAGSISQLQRIFLVTPPYPVVLGTCPAIQFQASCLPSFISEHDHHLQFSLGCQVILPPESFLSLRLPFVYGVQLEDQRLHALKPLEHQPELTAWMVKGTALQFLSKEAVLMGYSEYG